MTKRSMTKKFMRETGADKKTATDYLRQSQWNYGKAKSIYLAPDALKNFTEALVNTNWSEILESVAKAVEKVTESVVEILQSDAFQDACKAITEKRANDEEVHD